MTACAAASQTDSVSVAIPHFAVRASKKSLQNAVQTIKEILLLLTYYALSFIKVVNLQTLFDVSCENDERPAILCAAISCLVIWSVNFSSHIFMSVLFSAPSQHIG